MEKRQWLERLQVLEHANSGDRPPNRNRAAQLAAEDEEAQSNLHAQPPHTTLFSTPDADGDVAEDVFYVEYLDWMGDVSQSEQGSLRCSGCGLEIGRWLWEIGADGLWKSPLFAVPRKNVRSLPLPEREETPRSARASPPVEAPTGVGYIESSEAGWQPVTPREGAVE